MLGDAAGLARHDARLPNGVEERGLLVWLVGLMVGVGGWLVSWLVGWLMD